MHSGDTTSIVNESVKREREAPREGGLLEQQPFSLSTTRQEILSKSKENSWSFRALRRRIEVLMGLR